MTETVKGGRKRMMRSRGREAMRNRREMTRNRRRQEIRWK